MRIRPGNRRPSSINKNKRADKNFQASFTLNEIWELEKFPFQQLHSRKTQIRSVLNLEKVSVFGLSLWLYNKALIDQLVRSIPENIRTSVFRTDRTS